MVKMYTRALLMAVAVLTATCVFATDNPNANILSKKITRAHASGIQFNEINLFTASTGNKHSFLADERLYTPLRENILYTYNTRPGAISLTITAPSGKEYTLEMMESHPLGKDGDFGYIDGSGRHKSAIDKGLHYQGAIKGMERSVASMSIFMTGEVMILFANEDGNFNMGRLADGTGKYILYNDRDMLDKIAMPCGTGDEEIVNDGKNRGAAKTTGVQICNRVRIYWEADYGLFQDKGNLNSVQNYLTGLFNQKQALYLNENIVLELTGLYVWTAQDFYQDGGSHDALTHFRSHWNAQTQGFGADYAQLIARDPGGLGGVSYLDVLCGNGYRYGYADINGNYLSVPTYSWDVMVITHETGHALGSRHTHWCGWNTGAGNTCGAIDNCYTLESGGGCGTCTFTFNKNNTSWKGTIMSYCHLVSGKGIDLANGFGQKPGDAIRNIISSSSCLGPVISASVTATDICNNDGTVTLNFNTDNFGIAPYTFKWQNNDTAQNLTGLNAAGNYSVIITDSNACAVQIQTNVKKLASPGDGKAVEYSLPLCCKDTSFTFNLLANLPVDITSCQTVAWLRTPAAIASHADAQIAFNAAATGDIIPSNNSTAINTSTAAMLGIPSPVPCAKTSYYYTPFITRKPKAANTITANLSNTTDVSVFGTNIGKAGILSNQTAQATACDKVDTPATKTLSVTISNYTGRANQLTLLVLDADGEPIYRGTRLAGNGTYNISLANVADPLQEMTIMAMDYYCTDDITCFSSSLSLSATRIVTYPAISGIVFDKTCVVGKSVQLSFAPDSCYGLNIPQMNAQKTSGVKLYPNPASGNVVLEFTAEGDGIAEIRITDMLGKVVQKQLTNFYSGSNKVVINLHEMPSGIYFLAMDAGSGTKYNLKLSVE